MTFRENAQDLISIPPENLWPAEKNEILDWLITGTKDQRFIDEIFLTMCERLRNSGVSVARAVLAFQVRHPQWLGARILWTPGIPSADIETYGYGSENSPEYIHSPISEIHRGADEVRQRLNKGVRNGAGYAIYDDLIADGMTDYCAWPIEHTFGKRHVASFASDRPGGFSEAEVATLKNLIPALALVSEIRIKNRMARTLLETYVGPHAGEKILDGATTRGSGTTVGAAILICDLRNFTHISDLWPRDDVIELLNGYFDAMCDPIEEFGGEILKFMGDGLLAIFPLSNPEACHNLLKAIEKAQISLTALNEINRQKGHESLGYGIGVHVGDVMYGNIGSKTRLDFTVIGPAVNIASRLESLTKDTGRPVLFSREFVQTAGCVGELENLGPWLLRGLETPVEVYALPDRQAGVSLPTSLQI
ncbi:adenylate/guanylate cyclase domain-containing protein [Agrobacterium tumefaciens]|uniref:adenylate/guanylate cyclase domain-containing protein n=1 Tax=Agrobacterium tumefaciens TaxID=358 RepID=UPI00287CA340|nr:adenylate/guanylate cyclase domain-containing protein [Agrobacterium tumefaciens]MDS7595045.1 adenylate/guanylate cyclase domain-containing protein [Agrobacterium tumefaciens]